MLAKHCHIAPFSFPDPAAAGSASPACSLGASGSRGGQASGELGGALPGAPEPRAGRPVLWAGFCRAQLCGIEPLCPFCKGDQDRAGWEGRHPFACDILVFPAKPFKNSKELSQKREVALIKKKKKKGK